MIKQIKQALDKEQWTIHHNAPEWLQYLVGEVERLNVALYTHESYDKTVTEFHEENERLREALEYTRIGIGNGWDFGYLKETDEGDLQKMLDRINNALKEGETK